MRAHSTSISRPAADLVQVVVYNRLLASTCSVTSPLYSHDVLPSAAVAGDLFLVMASVEAEGAHYNSLITCPAVQIIVFSKQRRISCES